MGAPIPAVMARDRAFHLFIPPTPRCLPDGAFPGYPEGGDSPGESKPGLNFRPGWLSFAAMYNLSLTETRAAAR
jgi:hypothetical protein